LTAFVEGRGNTQKVSVIVEANSPILPPARIAAQTRRAVGLPGPASSRKAVARKGAGSAQVAMADLRRDLEALGLAKNAGENDLACAFVLDVTPAQLRELANLDTVRAIRLNKVYRRIASG